MTPCIVIFSRLGLGCHKQRSRIQNLKRHSLSVWHLDEPESECLLSVLLDIPACFTIDLALIRPLEAKSLSDLGVIMALHRCQPLGFIPSFVFLTLPHLHKCFLY